MPQRTIDNMDELRSLLKQEVVVTDYFEITQQRIDQFAEATEDRQWIHVDRERAQKESPFGGTIAHGFLTLSLLSHLVTRSVRLRGVRIGINYGLNYVRFLSVVPSGSSVRARITLQELEDVPQGAQATWRVMVERRGALQPCCVAEWLVRYYF